QRTYVKQSNASENDWRDLMGMLQVMGENQTASFTMEAARQVINVEQWLTHLAIMNLCGNAESGLNTGNNDDYYLYRGLNDPRFIFVYHDLDQIIGFGSMSASSTDIFRATHDPVSGDSEGVWRAMAFFMHHPQVEPLYYRILQNLLDGPFSQAQFDSLVNQVFGDYSQLADEGSTMIGWMNTRRATVQGVISGFVPPATNNPTATISGEPRSPTWRTAATLTVSGAGVTHYQWRLNNGAWSAETVVATPIALSGLATGSTNTVYVVGRNSGGIYQSTATPTLSKTWVVNTALPTVRLNEILARNDSAVNHFGTFPDLIELHNEGPASVTLTGMRLTDDPSNPGKFTFPSTTLAAGAYLVVYADSAATPGLHLGFALGQNGDSVYLFNTVASGGARLDSVQFGPQVPNLSIGRSGNSGDWALTQPTFIPGAANLAQSLGNPRTLKINEWRAASVPPTTEDFIELYNSDPLPVALGGMYLTDEPLGAPAQHRIADLSFVAGGGFAVFTADGSEGAGPEHLNFKLGSEQGQIGLFASDLSVVDCVVYGP
ncbi:MAG: lamin tail domain-containing protein, partial [Gammaproteobacteria bacterium]